MRPDTPGASSPGPPLAGPGPTPQPPPTTTSPHPRPSEERHAHSRPPPSSPRSVRGACRPSPIASEPVTTTDPGTRQSDHPAHALRRPARPPTPGAGSRSPRARSEAPGGADPVGNGVTPRLHHDTGRTARHAQDTQDNHRLRRNSAQRPPDHRLANASDRSRRGTRPISARNRFPRHFTGRTGRISRTRWLHSHCRWTGRAARVGEPDDRAAVEVGTGLREPVLAVLAKEEVLPRMWEPGVEPLDDEGPRAGRDNPGRGPSHVRTALPLPAR